MTRKRSAIRRVTTQDRTVDASRGTVLWAFNYYRSSMLTSLLNDLIDLENVGLVEEYCQPIQRSLNYFVNATTELPSGGFLTGALYKETHKFAEIYRAWNDIEGNGPDKAAERRKEFQKLRKQRQKISNKIRALQYELANDLDQKVLADTYKAVGNVINLVPDIFKNLASSYSEYLKRGGFAAA